MLWSKFKPSVVGFCVALIVVEVSDIVEVLEFEELEGLGLYMIVDDVGSCVVVLEDSDGFEVFDSEELKEGAGSVVIVDDVGSCVVEFWAASVV